ncbi:MAG: bifunctional DNA primase/polymerase [bacterium]|nr:bifunctional DNA primase/polymerase [bacterium]
MSAERLWGVRQSEQEIHTNILPQNGDMVGAALRYVKLGLSVIPVYGKTPPKLFRWKTYQQRLPTREEITHWFTVKYPNANIAIITGHVSGIIALDVDNPVALRDRHLPITPAQFTGRMCADGRPGRHYIFSHPGGVAYKTLADIEGTNSGLDIRADGGYIVVWPSIHLDTGRQYMWSDELSPWNVEPADVPSWLVPFLQIQSAFSQHTFSSAKGHDNAPSHLESAGEEATYNIIRSFLLSKYSDEVVAHKLMAALGIPAVQIEKPFCCILPGHEEMSPSAALYKCDPNHNGPGLIIYRDFHERVVVRGGEKGDGQAVYTLPEIYARVRSGGRIIKPLSPQQLAVWSIRALAEIGEVVLPELPTVALDDGVSKSVSKLYNGFTLLARIDRYRGTEHSPFSWSFAATWCDMGERQAGEAMRELLMSGHIIKTTAGAEKTKRYYGRELSYFMLGTKHEVLRRLRR